NPASPARTPVVQRAALPFGADVRPRALDGHVVQLIPTVALGKSIAPVLTDEGPVELPTMYDVEGVGPVDGQPDLLDAVGAAVAADEVLGAAGVQLHRAELEHKLSASARNATFSRMALPEGFTLAPLEVPGT